MGERSRSIRARWISARASQAVPIPWRLVPTSSCERLHRTISGTFTGSGGGTVSINTESHSLYLADSGATFDFPAGMLQLVGGSIDVLTAGADPVLVNSGFMTVPEDGQFTWNAGTLQNVGTLTVTGTSAAFFIVDPAVVDNPGTIDLEGDVSLAGTGTLNNSGILTVALSADDLTDPFYTLNNTGTIDVQSGTLNLGKSAITQETVENDEMSVDLTGGTWEVEGTGTLITVFDTHIITQNMGGTVILNGPLASYPSFAGLAVNGGSFMLEGGTFIDDDGQSLQQRDTQCRPGEHARRHRSVLAGEPRADDVCDRRHAGLRAIWQAHQHGHPRYWVVRSPRKPRPVTRRCRVPSTRS